MMRRNGCAFFALMTLCICSTLSTATLVLEMSDDAETQTDISTFSVIHQPAEKPVIKLDAPTLIAPMTSLPTARLLIDPAENTESLCSDCSKTAPTLKTISAFLSARMD